MERDPLLLVLALKTLCSQNRATSTWTCARSEWERCVSLLIEVEECMTRAQDVPILYEGQVFY